MICKVWSTRIARYVLIICYYARLDLYYRETKSRFLCTLLKIHLTGFWFKGCITSAYELFADLGNRARASANGRINIDSEGKARDAAKDPKNPEVMATRFKDTFSRRDVKVHFLGAWYVSVFLVLFVPESVMFGIGIPFLPLALSEERVFLILMCTTTTSAIFDMLLLWMSVVSSSYLSISVAGSRTITKPRMPKPNYL